MDSFEARLATLERTLRIQRVGLLFLASSIAIGAAILSVRAQQTPDTLRARHLIIEDESGRARIRLGAPLPGSGTPRTGMRITDTRGFERLGLNLFDDGRMVVGSMGRHRRAAASAISSASTWWPTATAAATSCSRTADRPWSRACTWMPRIRRSWNSAISRGRHPCVAESAWAARTVLADAVLTFPVRPASPA